MFLRIVLVPYKKAHSNVCRIIYYSRFVKLIERRELSLSMKQYLCCYYFRLLIKFWSLVMLLSEDLETNYGVVYVKFN